MGSAANRRRNPTRRLRALTEHFARVPERWSLKGLRYPLPALLALTAAATAKRLEACLKPPWAEAEALTVRGERAALGRR